MHKVVNQYNALKLNEYEGTFEVVSGNDKDGTFYMAWAIASTYDSEAGHAMPVIKDNGSYRNVPVKVVLGNRVQAIDNLKFLLGELEGHAAGPSEAHQSAGLPEEMGPSDDVPF